MKRDETRSRILWILLLLAGLFLFWSILNAFLSLATGIKSRNSSPHIVEDARSGYEQVKPSDNAL